MNKIFKFFLLFFVMVMVALFVTKPSEQDYLNRITADYSNIHPGMQLSSADLLEMGSTKYSSQLIFSTYSYKFGTIEVTYWGVLGNIYSSGYENEALNKENSEIINV